MEQKHCPTLEIYLSPEGGGIPQKERIPLTDEQAEKLLTVIKGLPPYLFVMLGLYAGLRREEILALKWDSVYLDVESPYLTVRRAWHTENNKPVIMMELKTKAAKRNIPLPPQLMEALKEAKESSISEYVIANKDGQPLSYPIQEALDLHHNKNGQTSPGKEICRRRICEIHALSCLG